MKYIIHQLTVGCQRKIGNITLGTSSNAESVKINRGCYTEHMGRGVISERMPGTCFYTDPLRVTNTRRNRTDVGHSLRVIAHLNLKLCVNSNQLTLFYPISLILIRVIPLKMFQSLRFTDAWKNVKSLDFLTNFVIAFRKCNAYRRNPRRVSECYLKLWVGLKSSKFKPNFFFK